MALNAGTSLRMRVTGIVLKFANNATMTPNTVPLNHILGFCRGPKHLRLAS